MHSLRKGTEAYAAHLKNLEQLAGAKDQQRKIKAAEAKAASRMAANQLVDKPTTGPGT